MRVVQHAEAASFLERAAPLLLANEARHNLILGIAGTLRDQPGLYPEQRLWLVEKDGEVLAAALQTPPFRLVLAGSDPDALAALVGAVGDIPGVVAAIPEAHVFAAAWADETGGSVTEGIGQGVYRLERVLLPRPASGSSRPADERDRPFLVASLLAFSVEALHEPEPDHERVDQMIAQRLGPHAESGFVLWEDDGAPVSVTGFGGPTPSGIRIGPVYTPPELRRRGYASALVAEVSQARLDEGKRFCFLYTDLANPTSNKIYVDIGYERVCESVELDFA